MEGMQLKLQNTFTDSLPADPKLENERRQVREACYSWVTPKETSAPKLVHASPEMCAAIGLNPEDAKSEDFLKVFSGNALAEGSKPYAMCYGGHQFGHWAGQLGDGRAINLGEVSKDGNEWTLQLKGAGETPYSRSADGLAVLRSSIREYLCSEAMYHLGVPTTRALSLVLTGDQVMRDMLYDGHPEYEKGAIACRVSPTFLRFGSYQIFAARGDSKTMKTLVDFTIEKHFPELGNPNKTTYLKFFEKVVQSSLELVIHWQRVGFVHGVLNTDNMSILGLTIDYGPYGWLEGYDHGWTPNTTDSQHKRYRYGAQPNIVLWNLYQLANALYPLIEDKDGMQEVLHQYETSFGKQYTEMMCSKLGLFSVREGDQKRIDELEDLLQRSETDMTIFFRKLADFQTTDTAITVVNDAFYQPEQIGAQLERDWLAWFTDYEARLKLEESDSETRKAKMNAVNPKYVLRNYMAQMAIDAADNGDYSLIDELFQLLKQPYAEQPNSEKWFAKRPEWARHKVGCSMLSCSS